MVTFVSNIKKFKAFGYQDLTWLYVILNYTSQNVKKWKYKYRFKCNSNALIIWYTVSTWHNISSGCGFYYHSATFLHSGSSKLIETWSGNGSPAGFLTEIRERDKTQLLVLIWHVCSMKTKAKPVVLIWKTMSSMHCTSMPSILCSTLQKDWNSHSNWSCRCVWNSTSCNPTAQSPAGASRTVTLLVHSYPTVTRITSCYTTKTGKSTNI